MSFRTGPFIALLALCLLCVACEKDRDVRGISISDYRTHLELAVDSACIQAPNIITPNGDGVNDVFYVLFCNIASFQVRIKNSSNALVVEYNDPTYVWNGQDSTGNGPYTVEVEATSSSGMHMFGRSSLTILDYGNGTCLNYEGRPVSGDQLDPRICGISYASHDVFCE